MTNEEGQAYYNETVPIRRMSARAVREWQPIETAPKDQDIYLAGQYLKSGMWDVQVGRWLTKRFPFVGENQPTHWMPLPDPPETK